MLFFRKIYKYNALNPKMKYLQQKQNSEVVKLDVKDKKILSILASDVRTPLTKLSKKVALSRDAVNYRIKQYEKKGLIQGYMTIVKLSKFGYVNYHLFIRLNAPSKENENMIIEKLKKYPFVRAIINFVGNFDLEIALIAKDILDLDEKVTEIISNCQGAIMDYEILSIVKTYSSNVFPRSFGEIINEKEKEIDYNADKKDIDILKIIGENATESLSEIAGKLKISADAVAYRIKNMKKSGIISKFIPSINYAALGYSLYTILLNISSLDAEKEKKLKDFLHNDKNILWAVKTIGRYNLIAYVLVKNVQELQETSTRLKSLFPGQINHYEMLVAYEEHKYVYFPKELF